MKKFGSLFVAILSLYIILCGEGLALSSEDLAKFQSTDVQYIEKASRFSVKPLAEPATLYYDPFGIAISSSNQVAIWSGPAPEKGYAGAINVYNENGMFLYGYQFKQRFSNGIRRIFFLEDSTLCFFSSFEDAIYTFTEEEALKDIYVLGSADYHVMGSYFSVSNSHILNADRNATCSILGYGDGRFAIRNSLDESIMLYDNNDEYLNYQKGREYLPYLSYLLMALALVFVFYMIFRKLDEQRD